jgi:hypothetical protein
MLDQPAARHRADGDAEARHSRPDPDRLGPLLGREDVREHGQRGRHDERAADAHQGAARDQGVGGRREGREQRPRSEYEQTGHQRLAATEAVTEAAHREQQAGEDQRVGVDDPLEGARRSVEITLDRRQGHVEDRVVERDDQQGDGQDGERPPPPVVCLAARRGHRTLLLD